MAKVSNAEKRHFRRTVVARRGSNLAKRVQPRGGLRR